MWFTPRSTNSRDISVALFVLGAALVLSDPVIGFQPYQAKVNAEAVVGRVVGAITGKKEGENIVDITTTIDLLQVFWEAERVSKSSGVGHVDVVSGLVGSYLQDRLLSVIVGAPIVEPNSVRLSTSGTRPRAPALESVFRSLSHGSF